MVSDMMVNDMMVGQMMVCDISKEKLIWAFKSYDDNTNHLVTWH